MPLDRDPHGEEAGGVRLATSADVGTVTALLRDFWSHEGRVVPHLEQNVRAILGDPGRGFFTLADDAGVATTTIRISTGGGASAEIEEVWVQPSRRGRGIGAGLIGRAVRECARRGILSVELRVSSADEEVGIPDFYAKQGFQHGGRMIYELRSPERGAA